MTMEIHYSKHAAAYSKNLKDAALFMHPGPVNWGVEMTNDVLKDPRCLILDQVNQGVYVRMALIYSLICLHVRIP